MQQRGNTMKVDEVLLVVTILTMFTWLVETVTNRLLM